MEMTAEGKEIKQSTKGESVPSPVIEEPEVKFYSWFLTTNYLHLVVYAIAVKRGNDFLYIEDHYMIRKCIKDNNTDC